MPELSFRLELYRTPLNEPGTPRWWLLHPVGHSLSLATMVMPPLSMTEDLVVNRGWLHLLTPCCGGNLRPIGACPVCGRNATQRRIPYQWRLNGELEPAEWFSEGFGEWAEAAGLDLLATYLLQKEALDALQHIVNSARNWGGE